MHPYFTQSYGSYLRETDQFNDDLVEIKKRYEGNSELVPFLILMDLMEGRVYGEELVEIVNKLRTLLRNHDLKAVFILDGDFINLSHIKEEEDIIYSNFFALVTYCQSSNRTQKVNKKWNYNSPLGLYTPGKLARPHRINLIAKLWKRNLLKSIKYSCQILPNEEQPLKEEFLKYDDNTFEKFKKEVTSILDLDYTGKQRFESNGYPYDVRLYEDTSFSIITESDFAWGIDGEVRWLPKLTEKTYKVMANKHPFIVCWYPGMIKKIEELGFKSFKEYLPFPNYNEIPDLHERINCTVENIKSFHLIKDNYRVEIEHDIEHNYRLLSEMFKTEFQKIKHILDLPQSKHPMHYKTVFNLVHFMFPIPNF